MTEQYFEWVDYTSEEHFSDHISLGRWFQNCRECVLEMHDAVLNGNTSYNPTAFQVLTPRQFSGTFYSTSTSIK